MFKKENLLYVAIGAFALFSLVVYVLRPGGLITMTYLSDIITVIAATVAFSACLVVSVRFKTTLRQAWSILTIGIGFYLLGEIAWSVLEIYYKIRNPFPSIADVFWLIGYPPLIAGLVLAWKRLGIILMRSELIAIIIGVIAIMIDALLLLLIPIAVSEKIGMIEKALDIAYPVGDIIVLIPALILATFFGRNILGRPWQLICIGLILISAADFGFSYLSWNDIYWSNVNSPGGFVDMLWVGGYLLIGVGAIYYHQISVGLKLK